MEHTPGPWKSGGCVVYGNDGVGVTDLVAGICNHNGRTPDETEANARLIATAPALLEALKFCRSVLKANPVEMSERMAIDKADAAIKAAKGDA